MPTSTDKKIGLDPEGPESEGKQANREFKATNTRRKGLSGKKSGGSFLLVRCYTMMALGII